MRRIRRLWVAMVAGAMFMAVLGGQALAAKPVTFTESVTFPDDNPCTPVVDPEEHLVTLNLEVTVHENRNNFVVHVKRAGSTDSGYTMIAGTESFVANGNVERGSFVDQWRHPDGSKFRVSGHFTFDINQGELRTEGGSFTCIGNN